MHLTINPLIFLYFLILDSISIVFTTLSTLFLDEHVVETIALQEIDTIVVPFVTLAHAHIGGNHDVSFTIMHTGDVGITDSAFNAGMLFWIEDSVAAIDVLIVVTITGNSVGCPLPLIAHMTIEITIISLYKILCSHWHRGCQRQENS